MLAGVLLHVIATAHGVDHAANGCAGLKRGVIAFEDVENLIRLLVLGDLADEQARIGDLQPASVEYLAAAGGIERRAVERDPRAAGRIRRDRDDPRVELVEKGIGVVETVGHIAIIPELWTLHPHQRR